MSLRGKFFTMITGMQNVNPISHPEMEHKMKEMSEKYSHTKPVKGFDLECRETGSGTRYQALKRKGALCSNKVIYYIHGGCYIAGLTYNYRDFCRQFCDEDSNVEIILLDYGLSPENKYPSQLNEAYDLWCEIINKKGISPENIIVGGDSSGGNLALALMLYIRDKRMEMPKGIFLLSPWTDMTASGKSYTINYRRDVEIGDKKGRFDKETRKRLLESYLFEYIGDADRQDPYVSPVFGEYSGFPPMLIFAGGDEMLLDDAVTIYKKAKSAGVEARIEIKEHMFHSYPLYMNYMPESRAACEQLKSFVSEMFK